MDAQKVDMFIVTNGKFSDLKSFLKFVKSFFLWTNLNG